MIDSATVERIMAAASIQEVVQDFVSLKKRGVNYLGLCPFHNEKTPSFTVSPAKGIFKCFGCGKGGNSVNFVMELEHLSYYDALKYLAKKYNIEVKERELSQDEVRQNDDRESMMVLNAWAQRHFSDTLYHHVDGKNIGLGYLKERGMRDETVKKFQLGYALDSRDAFSQAALRQGYKKEYLVKTGLTIDNEHGLMDRFFGRVIFPIHSISGRVIGFGGRILRNDKKTAKYLNSPESEVYHKSQTLYGIYFAKQAITRENKCLLVEGYTDVISLHQAGVENVVASSGTSLTIEQIRLIKRFTPNVTILYDGDAAGIKASLRGIDLVLEEGLNVRVLLLPEGEDPDSFARTRSASELLAFIGEKEEDFISFKTHLLLEDAGKDPVLRANLISDIVRSISSIPDAITRTVYTRECSRMLDIEERVLFSEVGTNRRKKYDAEQQKAPAFNTPYQEHKELALPSFIQGVFCEEQEKELIYYLLKFGSQELYKFDDATTGEVVSVSIASYIISEVKNDELEFTNLAYRQLFDEYYRMMETGLIPEARNFLHHPDVAVSELAVNILSSEHHASKLWEKHSAHVETEEMILSKAVPKAVIVYKTKIIQTVMGKLLTQLSEHSKNGELDGVNNILTQFSQLTALKMKLAKELDRVVL
ncbi:MAG TPA: DNA primase [Williamwhitmania sp.]|nr:DNA primase [Williamwhitmania sp.]